MSVPVRILFVEDSLDDVELVLHELRRGGFTPDHWVVETAESMRQALADQPWDLVIADHAMPRFDAPGALAVLQQSGQDLPFIVVSGHIGEEQAVACMKAGASDYLTKDNLVRLVPAVERELREAAQRRQRREAMAALSTSEERYRLLVENSADMITLQDGQGRITFASPSISRILGFPPAEVLGRRLRDFVHEDDAKVLAVAHDEVLMRGFTPLITGLRFRHRDGTWRIVEGSAARITEPDGTVGLVTTGRDTTERVQLEAQLHQAQKMEAVGRLASGVAHDFNNLLTVILGYSNLLLDQLDESHVLYQEVDEIKRAADRAATLTQQLLTFSRKQVLSLRPVDLNQVLGGLAEMLRRLIGEDVELTLKPAADLALTRVDPGQIEQMVMNLAANARDAMPQGGRLSIETANVELDNAYARRRAVQPGSYVMLAVTDTGQGMDAATQARLFEPFFTTKEPGKGTGLGLSSVYAIVRQCGGNIFVYSEPGRGSSFKIYLPRVDTQASARPSKLAPDEARGDETVVLVEDEPLVKNLVSEVLRKSGYQVMEFVNGRDALTRARRHSGHIHLLVTDVVMPGMSGIELARQLAPGRPEMRILFLSGYTDDLVERQGVLQPGRDFLQKPFTPDTLLRRVRALLDAPAVAPAERPAAPVAGPAAPEPHGD
jgi:two-component system cell cycle sensor histidine kinase/response regulator CckA